MSLFRLARYEKTLLLFCAITLLVLTQIGWWVTLFMRDVSLVEDLQVQNLSLGSSPDSNLSEAVSRIRAQSDRRRFMFWSESVFFTFLTCVGLFLMYQAVRKEASLLRRQKDFLDLLTHESQTPLTALKLRLENLRDEVPTATREVSLALDEVRRIHMLLTGTLDLDRLERDRSNWEPVSLRETIQQALRQLDPVIQAHGATLSTDIDAVGQTHGDPYAIKNCISNLVENALRHNPGAQKSVEVGLHESDGRIRLSVSDNGPRIMEADVPRIYEQFYRGRSSSRVRGSGLGLYFANRIMKAHGGEIQYSASRNGNKFEMILRELKA